MFNALKTNEQMKNSIIKNYLMLKSFIIDNRNGNYEKAVHQYDSLYQTMEKDELIALFDDVDENILSGLTDKIYEIQIRELEDYANQRLKRLDEIANQIKGMSSDEMIDCVKNLEV